MVQRFTALLLITVSVLFCLVGCADEALDVRLLLPEEIWDALADKPTEEETLSVKFYFNNTLAVKGYFGGKLKPDEKGNYERGELDESYKINTPSFMNAIDGSLKRKVDGKSKYEVTPHYIDAGWSWCVDDGVDSIAHRCTNEDGFFLGYEVNESLKLKSLIDLMGSGAEEGDVIIYMTSLSELSRNSADLIAWINESLSADGSASACLVGMLCDYNGYAISPDNKNPFLEYEDNTTLELTGKRMTYLLMTGPDTALRDYVTYLEKLFTGYSFKKDTDYNIYFFPERKVTPVYDVMKEVIVPPTMTNVPDYLYDSQADSLMKDGVINCNLNLTQIPAVDNDEIFAGVEDYLLENGRLNVHSFKVSGEGDFSDRLLLHMYVPLYDYIPSLKGKYSVGIYEGNKTDDENKDTKKDKVKLFYYLHSHEDGVDADDDGYVDYAELSATEVYSHWFEKAGLSLEYEIVDGGDVLQFDPENVSGLEDDEKESVETAVTLDGSHKWLHVTVSTAKPLDFDSGERGSLLMHIPVYAVIQSTVPDWIDACSVSMKDYSEDCDGALSRTLGLWDFVNIINQESDEKRYAEAYESKIAELTVCLSGLPAVSGS